MNREIISGVLEEFMPLCAIPHGSGNEKAVSDYLANRLAALGALVKRDAIWNIWADVPATSGREGEPDDCASGAYGHGMRGRRARLSATYRSGCSSGKGRMAVHRRTVSAWCGLRCGCCLDFVAARPCTVPSTAARDFYRAGGNRPRRCAGDSQGKCRRGFYVRQSGWFCTGPGADRLCGRHARTLCPANGDCTCTSRKSVPNHTHRLYRRSFWL